MATTHRGASGGTEVTMDARVAMLALLVLLIIVISIR
jgi:hypothetical protein